MRTAAFWASSRRRGSGRHPAALERNRRITVPAFLRSPERRTWAVVEGALLGALVATLVFMHQRPFYRAEARVVVNPVAAHASMAEAKRLLSSAATAGRVVRRVRAGALTASDLIARSSVASAGAGIIEYQVRDQSPPRAAALATEYAREFSRRTGGGKVLPATTARRVGARAFPTIALGAGAGLLLGMVVALLWNSIVLRSSGRRLAAKVPAPPTAEALSRVKEWLTVRAPPTVGFARNEFLKGELEPMSSDKQKLATDLFALEEERERVRTRMASAEEILEALDRQKVEAAGTVMNARRALGDLEERLTEIRQSLAEAEREEARRTLEAALAERDAAAMQLAETVEQTLDDINSLDAARAAAGAIHQAFVSGPGRTQPVALPPEPVALAEFWDRLVARIRTELDQNLEEELLEAAARNPLAHAIDDLPAHLRAAARERRRTLLITYKERERQKAERSAKGHQAQRDAAEREA
jgi:hypothetical protein